LHLYSRFGFLATVGFGLVRYGPKSREDRPIRMDIQELIAKLEQIEEQAQRTLEEFPKSLTKERLRMIIALARYLRTESSREPLLGMPGSELDESKPAPS
jgi:hypothetical protein